MCSAYRTAICKAKRGGFKDTLPEDLLAPVLKVFHFDLLYLQIFFLTCCKNLSVNNACFFLALKFRL